VVVANDNAAGGGIILALNAEAKAFGLKRGDPLFKVRNLIQLNHVNICQARHRLYHEISSRIMQMVLQQGLVLDFVQYSVDEFFGTMPLDDSDLLRHYVGLVKDLIWKEVHIPVSCGCAQSYTLAKVATHFAKEYKGYKGICVLPPDKRQHALELLPIGEVWGIGRKSRKKLEELSIHTAQDFVNLHEKRVRETTGTTGLRTWKELRGQPCVDLERPTIQGSIMQSRTFAFMLEKKEDLEQEVKGFVQACCVSLRKQQALCGSATLFIATNRHRLDLPQYANEATFNFLSPTNDTALVLKAVHKLLDQVYRTGVKYKRAGVVLTNIVPTEGSQLDLFSAFENERRQKLMHVADKINRKFGSDAIGFSSTKENFHELNAPLTYPNDNAK
ncbi:MAG: hypothetical protein SPJ13_07580, partial [Bacteroidales bacterium]|nr:hypothetical protein [Bacteroidales bacterium]